MKILKTVFVLALGATLFLGCERNPELDVRTFNLEHRSGYEAAQLIEPYVYGDREGAPGSMSALPTAISVRETPDNLERIARVLAEFDQAIPSIRLRFQLIEADSFTGEDPAIAEVVQELRTLFRFDGYRLLGEASVLVAGSTFDPHGVEQNFIGTDEYFLIQAEVSLERPGTVRVESIRLWKGHNDVILETSINVSAGQTIVIGGSKGNEGGRSFILTVKAESN